MDFGEKDCWKAEKIMAMRKFKRNRKAKKLLRYAVVAASAVLLSWSSVWIPALTQAAKVYFRFTCAVLVSPRFVFLMCNALVLTLAAKSGVLSGSGGGSNSGSPDLYEEFVKSSENRPKYFVPSRKSSEEAKEEEPVEKACVSEWNGENGEETKEIVLEESVTVVKASEKYERSQSERIQRRRPAKLQRSSTDVEESARTEEDCEDKSIDDATAISVIPAEPDINDFNQMVEEFIASQHRKRKEEARFQRKRTQTLAVVAQ